MTRNDTDALRLALGLCRNESPGRAAQIDSKLRDEPWSDVARFFARVSLVLAAGLFPLAIGGLPICSH